MVAKQKEEELALLINRKKTKEKQTMEKKKQVSGSVEKCRLVLRKWRGKLMWGWAASRNSVGGMEAPTSLIFLFFFLVYFNSANWQCVFILNYRW